MVDDRSQVILESKGTVYGRKHNEEFSTESPSPSGPFGQQHCDIYQQTMGHKESMFAGDLKNNAEVGEI